MRKFIILLILGVFCGTFVISQKRNSTQDLLLGTKWEPQNFFEEGDFGYVQFSKTEYISRSKRRGVIRNFRYDYYFSSSSDSVFDRSKVGKTTINKYIILDVVGYVIRWEITELTPTRLRIRNVTPEFSNTGWTTTYLPTNMEF